ncbi:MAG: transporter substrate-binding domain-containing protein [Colwellia sp.]|uniref:substrate-binding periplasmic protein n=1 Tax=Colwellia sp. TaxID=56799 RepID=UPI001DFDEA3F|nr:transporter substrate-binding domain-containing protein [Colwellia sp.]NQY47504.1 transporter substrate-binding domain-containing protein [Colwellia sp.]
MYKYAILFITVVIFPLAISANNSLPVSGQDNLNRSKVILTIAADHWCPFNCLPNSDYPGYMVEIAQQVFAEHNIKISYQIIPWSRALQLCRTGRISAVVGGYKSDAPDFIYPKNEQGLIGFSFFTLDKSYWRYQQIDSLNNQLLAVADGYAYTDSLDRYIAINQGDAKRIYTAFGNKPLTENIALLEQGLIDVLIETDAVFWYVSKQLNQQEEQQENFILAGVLSPAKPAYIAFSPAIAESKEYASILSEGIEQLRASGELSLILAKYGLVDWQ